MLNDLSELSNGEYPQLTKNTKHNRVVIFLKLNIFKLKN